MKHTITIRRITPEEIQSYHAIRLRAVSADPDAFLPTSDEEKTRTEDEMYRTLQSQYILGAYDGTKLVGLIALALQEKHKFSHIGILGSLFVEPAYRKSGIARLLMDHVLKLARELNLYSLQLKVVTTNFPAINLYKSLGFACWASEKNALCDHGRFMDQHHYHLVLKEHQKVH